MINAIRLFFLKKLNGRSIPILCLLYQIGWLVSYFLLGASPLRAEEQMEKDLVIIIPSFNNMEWLESNLDSILAQNYTNYRILYVDDCSNDGTGEAVREWLKDRHVDFREIAFDEGRFEGIPDTTEGFSALVNDENHYFTLIRNQIRCGALTNLYRAIQSCRDHEIVVTVDGDDWLYDADVLKRVNKAYLSGQVWLTHGCLIEYPWGNVTWSEPVPPAIVSQNAFRMVKCPSHLRTFYTWLFKKIKLDDLLYEGRFFPVTWDMAMMFPMIEMAGERHAYLSEVNYVYNMANQLNDNKVNAQLQNELDAFIRHKEPYQRLEQEND
ncbi:glycosyltransferase family 2 protein [Candidatus Protochlamydia phocaeensis]|uniref:glycosyltransferase family 2 protein n=1 Tax=Candidatus Protochlamydia phocaeensis TaxID=1414722 RepID=UPI0009AE77D8|nr:glycosyltransferase family A protein [Candidatus Protochlamydia phocaeensis]